MTKAVERKKITSKGVSMNEKAFCLICSQSIAVSKEYSIARHYNSKHKEKHKSVSVL
jgi:hypothetical protein